MEALAAVALAGNVLQFVDAATRLYGNSKALRRSSSGLTETDEIIGDSAERISELTTTLSQKAVASPYPLSREDSQLKVLADECHRHAQYILTDISNIQGLGAGRSKFLQSIRAAGRSMRARPEIQEKLLRLKTVQQELNLRTVLYIRDQSSEILAKVESLMEQNRTGNTRLEKELETLRNNIMDSGGPISRLADESSDVQTGSIETAISNLSRHTEDAEMYQKDLALLQALRFNELKRREDNIPDAHTNTLSWVFTKVPEFTTWLRNETGNEPFWIYGVPGSGKSTLMKYLSGSTATLENLQHWAGSCQLAIATFYFWAAGKMIQKSQEGLFRSLLYQILEQVPSLLHEVVLPMKSVESSYHSAIHSLGRKELLQILKSLPRASSSSVRFCLFIDGLDEYLDSVPYGTKASGSEIAQGVEEIIQVIKTLADLPNFKICISSRPWNPFVNAFGKLPGRNLAVHELNREDIRRFVQDTFEQPNSGLIDGEELQDITNKIVEASQGVFLWVFLVSRSLTRGIQQNQDDYSTLKKRLNEMPTDLDAFFQRMLDSVEEVYQEQASQILQVMLSSDSYNNDKANRAVETIRNELSIFACISHADPQFGQHAVVQPMSIDDYRSKMDSEEVRLTARCQDILQVSRDDDVGITFYTVDYIHRAAREFLMSNTSQIRLKSKIRGNFDPSKFRIQAYLYHAKTCPGQTFSEDDPYGKTMIGEGRVFETMGVTCAIGIVEYIHEQPIDEQLKEVLFEDIWETVKIRSGCAESDMGSFLDSMLLNDRAQFIERHFIQDEKLQIDMLHEAFNGLKLQAGLLFLRNGTDPNSISSSGQWRSRRRENVDPLASQTAWQRLLSSAFSTKKSRIEDFTANKQSLILLIKSALLHGADPFAEWEDDPREGLNMPKDLDHLLIELFPPSERTEVMTLLHEKREVAQRERPPSPPAVADNDAPG